MFDYTNFLYARPTFISGVSRVMDLGNTLNEYNSTFLPSVADYYAIKSDWIMFVLYFPAGINASYENEKQT